MGQLGDLAGHLDAGGAGADDDEGEVAVALGRGRRELGPLEGAEDAAAQLEGVVDALHPGGVLGELVVAEVGLPGAGRDEQRVERRHGLATQDLARHRLGRRGRSSVTVPRMTRAFFWLREDLAGARRDPALGEDAGRHLVEQRLEEVVGGLGDEGDLDVLAALQRLRAEEPTETRTDDDDAVRGHAVPPGDRPGDLHPDQTETAGRL